jgi:dinuclear metal center YbgI/SA1388 family protein
MKVRDILNIIDSFSPFFLQEDFDNSGIQVGNPEEEVSKIVVALDLTKEVVAEALKSKANLIVTHHPAIFNPLRNITSKDNPVLLFALRNNLNVISAHTNYDLSKDGLNDYVANLLAIRKIKPIIRSKEKTYKFATYVPVQFAEKVRKAIFEAGAGRIGNYSEASFNFNGTGTFKPLEGAKPFIGKKGKREEVDEVKIETLVRERDIQNVLNAMKKTHPYEEPAFDIYEILLEASEGIGLLGEIWKEMQINDFIKNVKKKIGLKQARLIKGRTTKIKKVALCTGSGGSLIEEVNKQNADLLITGDINYHQALHSREIGLNIIDIEHFYTEKFFIEALTERLVKVGVRKDLIIKSRSEVSPFEIL